MTTSDALDRARESYGRKAWSDAYAQFTAADQESPLEPADLERLATAAYLLGRDDDSADIWARAYHELLRRGDPERAARCALWLASGLMPRGELARAGAWVARARGLLDDGERDCVEQGYLLVMVALQHLIEGDAEAASTIFGRAAEVGDRFDEPHLPALARLFWGQALLMLGQTAPPTPPAPSSSPRATSAPHAVLRGAWTAWQVLDVPYEGARVRVLLGLACRQLGDQDGAEMELDAARWVFQQLGAVPELARVEALSGKAPARATGGLTAREVEVLRLVAAGKTNRTIAADLVLARRRWRAT
jgi:hypothetical protein